MMNQVLKIVGQLVAQMGLLLLRERVVREVFSSTAKSLAKRAGPGWTQDQLMIAAKAWEPPQAAEQK